MATSRVYMLSKSLATIASRALTGKSQLMVSSIRSARGFTSMGACHRTNPLASHYIGLLQRQQSRTFFSEENLKMEQFNKKRQYVQKDYEGASDKFFARIEEVLSEACDDKKAPVYTGDLSTAIFLCDGSDKQLDIVLKLVRHFLRTTSDELPYPFFSVAKNTSILMQLLHNLNRTDIIVKLFMDNQEYPNFMEAAPGKTFEVAIDALFNNEKYQEVIDIYTNFMKRTESERVPLRLKDSIVAVITCCYKLGTSEAYQVGLNAIYSGDPRMRFRLRTHSMIAAMALKHGEPATTLKMLSQTVGSRFGTYITVFNLRVQALAKSGRLEEAFVAVKQISSIGGQHQFLKDTVDAMREEVDKQDDPENKDKFESLLKELDNSGKLSTETLDEIFQNIISRPFTKTVFERQPADNRFGNRRDDDLRDRAPVRNRDNFRPRSNQDDNPRFESESNFRY